MQTKPGTTGALGNYHPSNPAQLAGQPPQPGAIARALAAARMLSGASTLVVMLGIGAELIFPPPYKPSHLIGAFGGNVEKSEIETKQAAAVEYAARQAAAAADAQARAAIETEAARKQQEVIADTFGFQGFMAQVFDLGCMVGSVIPPDARDPDTKNTGETLRSACGAGDKIRSDIVRQQARAAREGSAIMQRPTPQTQQPDPRYTYVPATAPPQEAGGTRFRPYGQIAP